MQEVHIMLPNKNELNDESIEQISGGSTNNILIIPDLGENTSEDRAFLIVEKLFTCSNCGKKYSANKKRTDGYCPNCEPGLLKMEIPTGDMKTTIPGISNKDGLVKIH